jgi:hypothetical protein
MVGINRLQGQGTMDRTVRGEAMCWISASIFSLAFFTKLIMVLIFLKRIHSSVESS